MLYGNVLHTSAVQAPTSATVHQALINKLYDETIALSESFNRHLDDSSRMDQGVFSLIEHVRRCCELQKVTTRLMNCLSWLITQRMVISGEISACEAIAPSRRLGAAPVGESNEPIDLPPPALLLIQASNNLYRRIGILDEAQVERRHGPNPVHEMLDRLV